MLKNIALLILFVSSAHLAADQTKNGSRDRVVITIERLQATAGRVVDTLDVTISAFEDPLAAYDLKIGCDNRQVEILDILPGEIIDSCKWEFFDTRPGKKAGQEGVPLQLWRTIALAETVPDEVRPDCYGLGREASLLRLVVSSEHVEYVPDTVVPVFFYWENCADNTVSSMSGNTLWISIQVVDYYRQPILPADTLFPTRFGAPRACIDPSTPNKPIRRVQFQNGGVEFVSALPDSIPPVPDSL